MRSALPFAMTSAESVIASIFQRSAGQWRSERRYYTLTDGTAKEMISAITVRFLAQGCAELQELASLHHLAEAKAMTCGAMITWNSEEAISGRPQSKGETRFGVLGSILYRDRGFATSQPITASFDCPNADTLCLRTEYNGSVFEEELKLVGQKYRTRQTIISRAGEEQMIGQYLETRIA